MRSNSVLKSKFGRITLVCTAALSLSGCLSKEVSTPPFYESMARVDAKISQPTAAQFISQYRANNGLGPVIVDPALSAIAQSQANAMASAGNVKASLPRKQQLATRMASIGEAETYAVENVSGGYRTLANAFSGWRDSPKHNKVMLDPKATRFGIATAYASRAKHKVFWSLVMAAPKS